MDYNAFVAEDRRLVILRVLQRQPDYRANSSVLQLALERLGHGVSRDQVRSDLAWLAEQQLVRTIPVEEAAVVVAVLTERGGDVAKGVAVVPGVKRPSPD